MSIATISKSSDFAEVPLGIVTLKDQKYVAVLHVKLEPGQEKGFLSSLQKTEGVCQELFKKVIEDQADRITAVGKNGFLCGQEQRSHTEKSTQQWNAFIGHLTNLNIPEPSLEKKPPDQGIWSPQDQLRARQIYEKFKDIPNFPELDLEEKEWLKSKGFGLLSQSLCYQQLNNLMDKVLLLPNS